MALRWVSCSMRTGMVFEYLPTVIPEYPLRTSLSTADTATIKLYLEPAGAPPADAIPADLLIPGSAHTVRDNWSQIYAARMLDAIEPRQRWLVCYDDLETTQPIRWVGYVTGYDLDTDTAAATVYLATAEGYLDRRYVKNTAYPAGTQRKRIARDLINRYIASAIPVSPGDLGEISSDLDLERDLAWQNSDNATVLGRMVELIGHFGGEFRIRWGWNSNGNGIVGRFDLDDVDNLGFYGPPPDLGQPKVNFDFPGSVMRVNLNRDDSADKGANTVVYYSPISGDNTSYTDYDDPLRIKNLDPDEPPFELRHSPGANIKRAELDKFARLGLRVVRSGAQTFSLQVSRDNMSTRHFGTDYHLADTVGVHIYAYDYDGRLIPQFPHGKGLYGRVIGLEVYEDYESPIIADKALYSINTDMDSSFAGNGS